MGLYSIIHSHQYNAASIHKNLFSLDCRGQFHRLFFIAVHRYQPAALRFISKEKFSLIVAPCGYKFYSIFESIRFRTSGKSVIITNVIPTLFFCSCRKILRFVQ